MPTITVLLPMATIPMRWKNVEQTPKRKSNAWVTKCTMETNMKIGK